MTIFRYSPTFFVRSPFVWMLFLFLGGISFAAQATSWIATDSMSTSRSFHTATLLANGKVLVTGGKESKNLATAELYNPITGTWNTTGSMSRARSGHTATLLSSGNVLVVGGNTAELYNPATGTWSDTAPMGVDHSFHTATLLANGKVLVAGGNSHSADAELYDPATGTWSSAGKMNTIRGDSQTATLLDNGKVLIEGGNTYGGDLYDPATNGWIPTGSMRMDHSFHTATLLTNGKVLVVGGWDRTGSFIADELYDPAINVWVNAGAMSTPRGFHTATQLVSGKVLVVGGAFSNNGSSESLASTELYDPTTSAWNTTGAMSTARQHHTATLLSNGKVLVVGGGFATAELYSETEDRVAVAKSDTGNQAEAGTNQDGDTKVIFSAKAAASPLSVWSAGGEASAVVAGGISSALCVSNTTGTGTITGKIGTNSSLGLQIYNSLQALVRPSGKGDAWAILCRDEACRCPVIPPQKVISNYIFSSGFPKDFTIAGVPDGQYKLWMILDTEESKKRGKSFDVEAKATEFDLTTCGTANPSEGNNPSPVKVDITVSGGKADVGVLRWCHIYFDAMGPKPTTEKGYVVIGAEDGAIRLLDLNTTKIVDANPGTPAVDSFKFADGDDLWTGNICGMIRGAGKRIYVLGYDGTGSRVFMFDMATKRQVGTTGGRIPGGIASCRGTYYKGTRTMLYLLNRPGTKPASTGGAMASIDVTNLATGGNMPYKIFDNSVDPLFNRPLAGVAVVGNTLAILSENDDLVGGGRSTLYVANITPSTGALTLKANGSYATYFAGSTTGYECGGKVPVAGLQVANFAGKPYVFVGNLSSISIFNASTTPWTAVDYDSFTPGIQGLDTTLYGQVIAQFEPSPDKKQLWLMPECKSTIHLKFKLGGTGNPQTFNRHRLAVLDLSTGTRPDFLPAYSNNPEFDDDTANPDPGFDFDDAYLKKYIVYTCAGCAGGTPPTIFVGPQIVVGKKSLWIRGAGVGGAQGLGQFSDISGYDIAARQGYLFRGFNFWMNGGSGFWGYDITPDSVSPSTGWMLYMEK